MKAICDYVNPTEVTVLRRIRELRFPFSKIGGGNWESDTELIDCWRIEQIEGDQLFTGFHSDPRWTEKIKKRGLAD